MSSATPLPSYSSYEFMLVSSPSPFVAHVEINRPKKLNAFTPDVWVEFGRVFRQISADPEVRVVVLSGAGNRAFTAGLDVQAASEGLISAQASDPARKAKPLREHIGEFQESISAMEKCEKPVICVLHDIAIGLAIDIACCADIRICASNVRLSVKEVDIGMAADVGTLARLPKIVGSTSWVKDVCMSARDFSAEEALAVGFASQVHPDKARAVEAAVGMATVLAEKSPIAVQGTKELLNYGREHGTADSLRYTAIWNTVALQGADFSAALQSGLKRTRPRFEKL